MKEQIILRVVATWNIPFMVVFGIYIITHGELGPGGGFQGGVVLAAGFILYGLVFGAREMRRIVPRYVSDLAAALGVLACVGIGLWSMLQGYEFLDHTGLYPSDPGAGEVRGMAFMEYAIGLTVAAVMLTIFNEITEGTTEEGPESRIPGSEREAD
jgi:multicomponent Na+:H+ antiporter subunit B